MGGIFERRIGGQGSRLPSGSKCKDRPNDRKSSAPHSGSGDAASPGSADGVSDSKGSGNTDKPDKKCRQLQPPMFLVQLPPGVSPKAQVNLQGVQQGDCQADHKDDKDDCDCDQNRRSPLPIS
jgi:hypothetical protein